MPPPMVDFQLFETMLLMKNGQIWLVDGHLDRLEKSALALGFDVDLEQAKALLATTIASLDNSRFRLRLTLAQDGDLALTSTPLPPGPAPIDEMTKAIETPGEPWSFALSPTTLASADPLLQHKTTKRSVYDNEYNHYTALLGVNDIVYLNERAEICEGSRTNIFALVGGDLVTPPLACGLLPGVLRGDLLQRKKAKEAILTLDLLKSADALFLGNSVQGLRRAMFLEAS